MKKFIGVLLAAAVILLFTFCKTTPPEEEKEEETVVEEEEQEEKAKPVSDREIARAKDAIERAEAIEADKYAPDSFGKARDAYDEAMKVKDSDPDKARELLSEAKKHADESYDAAASALYEEYAERFKEWEDKLQEIDADRYRPKEAAEMYEKVEKALEQFEEGDVAAAKETADNLLEELERFYEDTLVMIYNDYQVKLARYERRLKDIEAHKWEPEKTEELYDRLKKAKELFEKENFQEARETADKLLADLEEFYETLDENIRWANILKRDSEMYFEDADEVEAFIWAPEELEKAIVAYAQGLEAYRNYNLEESIAYLEDAKGYGQKAVRVSPHRKAEYQTQALQEEVQEDIEEASEMTVITEEGEVIEPEQEEENESDSKEQSKSNEIPDGTAVLGDVSAQSLLDQAKELYELGVEQKEKGNYKKANEYFREAGRLVHEYKSMAVGQTRITEVYKEYTLWYIAEKEWGSAFLWPLIWEHNRETVRDPDLIFPGEKIFIPSW